MLMKNPAKDPMTIKETFIQTNPKNVKNKPRPSPMTIHIYGFVNRNSEMAFAIYSGHPCLDL